MKSPRPSVGSAKPLSDFFASHPEARKLLNQLENPKQHICVEGLVGSSPSLLYASLFSRVKAQSWLFILDDEEEAGYFYHDLKHLTSDFPILFFPSSYRRAIKYNQKDEANMVVRTEVLTHLHSESASSTTVVVTYPEALAEKVVSREELMADSILFRVGSVIDVGNLEQRLFDFGFHRTDYVYEPGQFAIRGSIVDVFSYSSDRPLRIDFFGDEVDSMRMFDVTTQLSDEKLTEATVVPDMTRRGNSYIAFTDFLGDDTIAVARNFTFIRDRIDLIHREGYARQAETERQSDDDGLTDYAVLTATAAEVTGRFDQWRCISSVIERKQQPTVRFCQSPQPLFHKNFELLHGELLRLQCEGYLIQVFADSEKQLERLHAILNDSQEHCTTGTTIRFQGINHAIHAGFIDHTLKQCFLTDHQIFDRYHRYSLDSDKARRGKVALSLKELQQLEVGDFVVHIDHGIGRFGGLVRVPVSGQMQEMIKLILEEDPDRQEELMKRIMEEISENVEPVRPERKYPRAK